MGNVVSLDGARTRQSQLKRWADSSAQTAYWERFASRYGVRELAPDVACIYGNFDRPLWQAHRA